MDWDELPEERIDFLHGLVGDVKNYKIFLGHDIDNPELGKPKIPFYEKIAQIGDRLGHKIFVPYRFTKFPGDPDEMNPRDTHDLMEAMIAHCNLIVCYLGINSTSVGHFIGKGMMLGKEFIYFLEKGVRLETVVEVEGMVLSGIIPEAREDILKQPRIMFNRTMTGTLYRYPHIKEIIQYSSEEEGLARLEAAIKKHLIT
ncbi:hypothetical protein KY336_04495 [Candidatus Woesearchaeota archaeon]|nr:hypothetical protein [Candidatus Woesearchaeota archaeon]